MNDKMMVSRFGSVTTASHNQVMISNVCIQRNKSSRSCFPSIGQLAVTSGLVSLRRDQANYPDNKQSSQHEYHSKCSQRNGGDRISGDRNLSSYEEFISKCRSQSAATLDA
jgi:hypothetical protein